MALKRSEEYERKLNYGNERKEVHKQKYEQKYSAKLQSD